MEFNLKKTIDNAAISKTQYATIFVCFLMNMLDGMDVMVISYTAPAIAKFWEMSPEKLGVVFSAGLAGMTIGTLFIAPLADKFGRKNLILFSAFLMGVSIFLTAFANSQNWLMFFRFLSGLGIGCVLASTATLTAEYTPNRSKDFWISFVLAGYPVGAILSGIASAKIIPLYGWQQVFIYAGIVSLFSLPIAYLFLSESLDYLVKIQPKNALIRINILLQKLGATKIDYLPQKPLKQASIPINKLLDTNQITSTIKLWFALFFAFAAMYFLVNWIPKLATNAGLSMDLAIYSGTVFNVGAFFGIITQGYLSMKFGLKRTIGIVLLLTAILMASFGIFVGSDAILVIFGLLGFGIQGGFVGLYAVAARLYPTEFRNTGMGWAMGAGRIGGIISPIIGGLLVGLGFSMTSSFLIFAIPTLLAGVITLLFDSKKLE